MEKEQHCNCHSHEHENENQMKSVICFAVSFVLFVCGFFVKNTVVDIVIYFAAYLISAYEIIIHAVKNMLHGSLFDENMLMSIASIGAFAVGNRPEAVAVILFYRVGELLQDMAVDKSRASITALMDIRPDYANVIRGGKAVRVSPEAVKIGEIITVNPGERIPLDGIVEKGSAFIDTKALTGESVPKRVQVGDLVFCGGVNTDSPISIKVEKEYSQSTVSKILDTVQYAQSKKARSEKFITRFAKYYTPAVVLAALLVAVIPSVITHDFRTWIYRGLMLLVVSCPCALVVSVPLGFFTGIGISSKNGILIKGGNYLENMSRLDSVVFDKTGTLTRGEFKVTEIKTDMDKDEFLKYAAYCEYYSSHPIAASIREEFADDIDGDRINSYREISGMGVSAEIDGKKILLGNKALVTDADEVMQGKTAVYMSIDGRYSGYIIIDDSVKPDSKLTVEKLTKLGINTVMLTGDNEKSAASVGEELGVKRIYSRLMPNDKVTRLEEIINAKKENSFVAFVGDGINDAPVLARADIGIAMGAIGSDSAVEAADIVLMTDEPSKILAAISISKRTMQIIRENIVFAVGVKLLIMIFSAMGLTNMWLAVFGDVGVALLAIINLFKIKKAVNRKHRQS